MSLPTQSLSCRVCMHLLAMVHLSVSVLNMAVSQNFIISHFLRQCTNLNAQGPGAENTTGAQIDCLHAYLTCHVEIFEKGQVISKNQLSKGHTSTVTDKRGKKGHSMACKDKFSVKGETITLRTKPMWKIFQSGVFTWIRQNS
jgi:hypothetical protein